MAVALAAQTTAAVARAGHRVAEPATVVGSQPLETLLLVWLARLSCPWAAVAGQRGLHAQQEHFEGAARLH